VIMKYSQLCFLMSTIVDVWFEVESQSDGEFALEVRNYEEFSQFCKSTFAKFNRKILYFKSISTGKFPNVTVIQ